MENKAKKYVGNGRQVGGYDLVNFSICIDKLDPNFVTESNGKKYIKLTMSKNRTVDQYGNTHAVYINEYKKPIDNAKIEKAFEDTTVDSSDLPF